MNLELEFIVFLSYHLRKRLNNLEMRLKLNLICITSAVCVHNVTEDMRWKTGLQNYHSFCVST